LRGPGGSCVQLDLDDGASARLVISVPSRLWISWEGAQNIRFAINRTPQCVAIVTCQAESPPWPAKPSDCHTICEKDTFRAFR